MRQSLPVALRESGGEMQQALLKALEVGGGG